MTATLQTKKGRPYYYVILRYEDETTGKERQKWVTTDILVKGNNKRKAEKMKEEILAQYEREQVDLSKNALFVDFMAQWLETRKDIKAIALTTYDGYKAVYDRHIMPYFEPLKLKVRDLTPSHLEKYMSAKIKVLSPNSVLKHMYNISKCLDHAIRQNIIAFNPAKRIDLPQKITYKGAKFYNESQIEQLLKISQGDPLEIVILLAIFYGLARSEVLGVKWDAIDFENNTIAIKHTVVQVGKIEYRKDSTKNDNRNAVIPLTKNIVQRLKWWKAQQEQHKFLQPNDYVDEGYVCTQIDGSLIKSHYISAHFKLLLEKNNMPPIRFHDLRHSSAGYLKYLGFDLKDIQTWLRHGDISTTMNIYVNLDMDAKRAIANDLSQRFEKLTS